MLNDIMRIYLRHIDTLLRCGGLRMCWNESAAIVLVIAVFFTAGFSPAIQATDGVQARGATLEIVVSQLDKQPVLLFLQAEKGVTNHVLLPDSEQPRITSAKFQFDPPLQVLPVGTTIEVVNQDPVLHNTHVFNGSHTLFNVATPNADITVQRTFSRPGLFGVRCDLHPSMNAWIAVVSDANYAVIDKPGVYRIENIEPGRYEVHIQRPERQDQVMEMELFAAEERKIQLPP